MMGFQQKELADILTTCQKLRLTSALIMELPKEFDVIVLGTGMPESIVAAAFARIGQTVLHLDRRENYSGDWASYNLQGIEKWADQHSDDAKMDCLSRPIIDESSVLEEGECLVEMPLNNTSFSTIHYTYLISDDVEESAGTIDSTDAGKPTKASEDTSSDNGSVSDNKSTSEVKEMDNNVQNISDTLEKASVSDSDVKSTETANNEEKHAETQDHNDKSSANDTNSVPVNSGKDGKEETFKEGQQMTGPTSQQEKQEPKKKSWSQKRIKEEWRRFNLDICPKVLYSVGDMVSLLIESDIAKYCEFKTVTQILTLLDNKIEKVPCSRSDVFSSKRVSMLEKRMLMKFIQFCLDFENKQEEIADQLDQPFCDFLKTKKLTPTIQHYVQHSIAMATDSMTARQGLEQMKKFLSSLGRYGNTAFLWSLYGSGELPQAFCRMCAVFGGVYCLRTSASSITLDKENKCTSIITTEGQKIKCKWLIMESSYAPETFVSASSCGNISRSIIMTDKPLLTDDEQEQLSMMNIPCPDDGDRPTLVLQLPPSSMTAPQGIYVTHLTRKAADGVSPEQDLSYAVNSLFPSAAAPAEEEDTCRVLWSLYFSQQDRSQVRASDQLPANVVLVSGPGPEMDIDKPVTEAKDIFKRILPEEEFLPKAPNPEDIIYVDDTEAQVADSNEQSEFADQSSSNQSEAGEQSLGNQSETAEQSSVNQSEAAKQISANKLESVGDHSTDQSEHVLQKSKDQSGMVKQTG